jgi:hypothetical protein
VTLDPTALGAGNLFSDAVIVMLLAIFEPRMTFEVHASAEILSRPGAEKKGVGL